MTVIAAPYPWITWQVSAAATVTTTANGVAEATNLPSTLSWGLAVDGSGLPTSDSLWGRLATALVTHSEISVAAFGAVAAGSGGYGLTSALSLTVPGTINAGDKIQWSSAADAAVYGYPDATTELDGGAGTYSPTQNPSGQWWPASPTGWCTRAIDSEVRWSAVEADMDHSAGSHVVWDAGSDRRSVVYQLELVDRARVDEHYAAHADHAAVAGRSAADTYGLLSQWLRVAVTGATCRLYFAAGDYDEFVLRDTSIRSVRDLWEPAQSAGRYLRVTIPARWIGTTA